MAAPLSGLQFEVSVAVVDRVDGDARGVEDVGGEGDVGGEQERLQLLHGARADDRQGG